MIALGDRKKTLYKGDFKPAEFPKGGKVYAGFHPSTQTGESLSFSDTYNDTVGLKVEGKSTQAVTVQGKNLLDLGVNKTFVTRGITIIANQDTLVINGICTGLITRSAFLSAFNKIVLNGTYTISIKSGDSFAPLAYVSLTNVDTGNADIVMMPSRTITTVNVNGTYYFGLQISEGTIFNNFIISFQLEQNTVATAYAPFVPNSPSPEYPSPIVSFDGNVRARGANLINNDKASFVYNGVTATNNGDGTWTLNGTALFPSDLYLYGTGVFATSDKRITVVTDDVIYGYCEILSGTCSVSPTKFFSFHKLDGVRVTNFVSAGSSATVTENGTIGAFRLTYAAGTVFTNYVVRFWLSKNQPCSVYEPYRGESSIALGEMGGLPSGAKAVYENVVKRVPYGKLVLNGTENWVQTQGSTVSNPEKFLYRLAIVSNLAINDAKTVRTLCTHFKGMTADDVWYKNYVNSISVINNYIYCYADNTAFPTVDSFKAFLAANRPVVQYELAQPTDTPIQNPLKSYPHTTIIEQSGAVKATLTGTVKVAD